MNSTLIYPSSDNTAHFANGLAQSILNKQGIIYREEIKLPNPNSSRIMNSEIISDYEPGANIVNVYPNPVSDVLFVEYAFIDGFIAGNTLVVYNIKGEKVKEVEVKEKLGYTEINVFDLPNGIYIISLGGNKDFSAKFTINR